MIYGVYAIRDVKTGFMTPTIESNDAAAIRNFSHAVVNSDSILFSFAPDFALYRIASFDSDSAAIVPETVPVHLYDAAAAIRSFGTPGTPGGDSRA